MIDTLGTTIRAEEELQIKQLELQRATARWGVFIERFKQAYEDDALMRIYLSMRERYNHDTDQDQPQAILPTWEVYICLRNYFEPKYGPKWLFNREVLESPLLEPWLCRPKRWLQDQERVKNG